MEGFNAEKQPQDRDLTEAPVPAELLAVNDEYFFETGDLALKNLGNEFIRRRFELANLEKQLKKHSDSAFINSLRFTEDNFRTECARLEAEIGHLGRVRGVDTEAFFSRVDSLLREGKE